MATKKKAGNTTPAAANSKSAKTTAPSKVTKKTRKKKPGPKPKTMNATMNLMYMLPVFEKGITPINQEKITLAMIDRMQICKQKTLLVKGIQNLPPRERELIAKRFLGSGLSAEQIELIRLGRQYKKIQALVTKRKK